MNTKVTEEELNQIKTFKVQLNQITFALGENRIIKENLLSSYKTLFTQEQEYYTQLATKYGNGSVDLNTGEITAPNE